jgi:hypothetical protein
VCAEQNFSELRPKPLPVLYSQTPQCYFFISTASLLLYLRYFNRLKKKLLRFHWEGDCSVLIIHMLQN